MEDWYIALLAEQARRHAGEPIRHPGAFWGVVAATLGALAGLLLLWL